MFTTIDGNAVFVTIDSTFLYLPNIIPSLQTQLKFKESNRNSFTLPVDSWTTDRKHVNTSNEYQLDKGSTSNVNSPLYLKAVHQRTEFKSLSRPPDEFNNQISDNGEVRKYFVKTDAFDIQEIQLITFTQKRTI